MSLVSIDDQRVSEPGASEQPATPTDPAKQSVEELFEQPFEPQWMRDRRLAEAEAFEEGVTLGVRKAWDRAAAMSRARIAAKFPGKKRVDQG